VSRCRLLAVGIAVGVAALPAASAEAAAGKAKPFGTRSLAPGMRGHDVRVLQDFLTRVGIATPVDGSYGPYTARRVRTWERRVERRVDGRMARPDARVLRRQVESGERAVTPEPAAPAVAPDTATLGADGRAIAPESAPPEVKATIAAANRIVGKPYKYGGGHGRWEDSGYDCSGSMSYALHDGGFVERPMTSSDFAIWEKPGKGMWITTYGNSGHSFMVVAGLRFDTGYNNSGKGPRWSEQMRPTGGYSVRHPAGF
jgi:cell wall-associated NlpC family hydrolase